MLVGSNDAKAAGEYAQRRYERGLRSWRAKNRRLFAIFFGPLALTGAIVLVLGGHAFAWCAGAVSGISLGAWITLREEPPFYIERWLQGAEGERKTAKALKPLQRSGLLHVVHDIQTRYGNYDHVVVSEAGVFLLETKNLNGIVVRRDGVPHLLRWHDPDAHAPLKRIRSHVLSAAVQLKHDIEQRTGHCPWVQAVIVFWADFPEGIAEHGRCVYVHGTRLRAWLEGQQSKMSAASAERIASAIRRW